MSFRHGFTLIELILVIGIIAIVASIVIVAVNPSQHVGEARDAKRTSDVTNILNAVLQYALDERGALPLGILKGTPKTICQADVIPEDCVNKHYGVNLRMLSGSYITNIPKDPLLSQTGTGTRYQIWQEADGKITVAAPDAERGEIKKSR